MTRPEANVETRLCETCDWNTNTGFASALLKFFFQPTTTEIPAFIRIATGTMIAYIHFVWLIQLSDFMGPNPILNLDVWRALHSGPQPDYKWTYLAYTDSLWIAQLHTVLAMIAGLFAAVGLLGRFCMIVAWFLTLQTAHRLTGFLFGLDQVVLMLSSYLCLSSASGKWSIDRFLVSRIPTLYRTSGIALLSGVSVGTDIKGNAFVRDVTWNNTIALRLIQIHLCVVYFFGGIGKLRGEMWWDGTALWYSAVAYEYQSLDLTWIGRWPTLVSLLTHLTLFWEVGYFAIVWPRWTRAWTLAIAFCVHAGIALYLGMVTFGWMMIVANSAFIPSDWTMRLFRRIPGKKSIPLSAN